MFNHLAVFLRLPDGRSCNLRAGPQCPDDATDAASFDPNSLENEAPILAVRSGRISSLKSIYCCSMAEHRAHYLRLLSGEDPVRLEFRPLAFPGHNVSHRKFKEN